MLDDVIQRTDRLDVATFQEGAVQAFEAEWRAVRRRHTGDAAGQNMVTIATQAICDYLLQAMPQPPQFWSSLWRFAQ